MAYNAASAGGRGDDIQARWRSPRSVLRFGVHSQTMASKVQTTSAALGRGHPRHRRRPTANATFSVPQPLAQVPLQRGNPAMHPQPSARPSRQGWCRGHDPGMADGALRLDTTADDALRWLHQRSKHRDNNHPAPLPTPRVSLVWRPTVGLCVVPPVCHGSNLSGGGFCEHINWFVRLWPQRGWRWRTLSLR
jgi:hypothetical protein